MARTPSSKQFVYGTLITVLLAVAVYQLVGAFADPITKMPDTPELAQDYICRRCGEVFTLTPRERAEWLSRGAEFARDEEMTPVRHLRMRCPSCDHFEVVVARSCPGCGQAFARIDVSGERHTLCAACKADKRSESSRTGR
jgi:hypothetical protein